MVAHWVGKFLLVALALLFQFAFVNHTISVKQTPNPSRLLWLQHFSLLVNVSPADEEGPPPLLRR
jgi:hypothetical protein